jgi:hypothetical protein
MKDSYRVYNYGSLAGLTFTTDHEEAIRVIDFSYI